MLMSPNKGKTAVHGCQCPGDMVVRMRKVLPYRRVGMCALVQITGIVWKPYPLGQQIPV